MITVEGTFYMGKIELLTDVKFDKRMRVFVTFTDTIQENHAESEEVDPIKMLRGCHKNLNLTEKLLRDRKEDIDLEESIRRK